MPLRAHNGESPRVLDFLGQLDVGASAGHVGGDGHRAGLARLRDHFRLALVHLRVQDLVLDAAHAKHLRQQFADFDRGRAHEDGTALVAQLHHVFDDRIEFFALGLVDEIVFVRTRDGTVGGDHHDIQLVDLPQLPGLRLRRSGHPGQLVVHPEVVLQGHGGIGLRGRLHLHALLRLNRLVQSVAVASAIHDAARLLVDDLHLVLHHDVLDVLLEQRVGLEQLVHAVDAGALDAVVLHELLLLF